MPIYEYQCKKCNNCFERLVFKSDEPANVKCPQCGASEVARLMSCANALGGEKSPFCGPGASGFFLSRLIGGAVRCPSTKYNGVSHKTDVYPAKLLFERCREIIFGFDRPYLLQLDAIDQLS